MPDSQALLHEARDIIHPIIPCISRLVSISSLAWFMSTHVVVGVAR